MNKRIIIGILAAVLLGGVVWVLNQPRTEQTTTNTTTQAAITEDTTTSGATAAGTTVSSTMENTEIELQSTEDVVSDPYTIQRGDITLYGVITAARNYQQEKRPLLVMSHGFNNTLEMNENYAEHLAKLGYLVYRFDFYGGSRQSKSGGTDMLTMSVVTEKEDLTAVVEKLAAQSFVDEKSITLLGVSQGGVVSTLYAAEYPERIKKLILLFPAFVLFDDVKETYQNLGVASPSQLPAIVTHRNARLGAIYLQDALNIDIDAEIAKVQADTLIVHGTNDEVVPYLYAQNANQRFIHSTLVTVPSGSHRLDTRFNQIAFPAIDEFVAK